MGASNLNGTSVATNVTSYQLSLGWEIPGGFVRWGMIVHSPTRVRVGTYQGITDLSTTIFHCCNQSVSPYLTVFYCITDLFARWISLLGVS